ncbi:MAG: response regulator [Alphaproteobacteria bacterium]
MEMAERLAKERRARLAAERLLEQKSRELFAANEKLSLHARSLSDQIVVQREVVKSALTEAEALKGQNNRIYVDLNRAQTTAVMAERRLWDSINTFQDGFAVFDTDLQLIAANKAFMKIAEGLPVTPGITIHSLTHMIAEAGRFEMGDMSAGDFAASLLDALNHDDIEPATVPMTNGTWLRLVSRRARDGDLVMLAMDITEQMRIWAAIEAIPDGFVLFDREDRLLTSNQRYRDIFKVSAPAIVPGARFEDILRYGLSNGQYADTADREEEWLSQRIQQHRNPGQMHEQLLGDGRWIMSRDHPTPDGGRVGLRVDITEAKEQHKALLAAREAAWAASKAKSAFLANMSHEIRTPMNGVVGMAELLCDSALSQEQRLFAETIKSSGEALLVIINDILDYSKIEAEKLTLYPEPFDLERTIHEVAMLLQPKARSRGIDLIIDYDMFLPTRFVGDPGRLRQILTNLVGNAVKFTERGHVLVRVVGLEVEGGHQLHVTVEDTGIGIADENLDDIFGEFNQVESESNRKFEGTGLGLAITQRLIERMDGAVWVDSELGKGSCFGFRLVLPVAEGAVPPHLPINLRRVLVVDDQFINRTILERQLEPCGLATHLCRSGAEALEVLARDQNFDAILTDHNMPEMDGLMLAQRIRARGLTMPIVMLTSNPTLAQGAPGSDALAAVIQKPTLRADLYRQLQALTSTVPDDAASAAVAVVARRQMRVMTAEDNRTNQLVFQKMVKDLDIELVFANNGREAVDLFRSFRPDLIFMDISMPEMDGRQATRAIREMEGGHSHVPIVALTAHAMDGDSDGILAAGIDRYMTKPLRKAAIIGIVAEFCPKDVRALDLERVQLTGT